MERRETQLHEIEQSLPKPNGTYLSIILGSVNVSILNKHDKWVFLISYVLFGFALKYSSTYVFFRFKYKDEYEKFKLILSGIGFILSVVNLTTNIR